MKILILLLTNVLAIISTSFAQTLIKPQYGEGEREVVNQYPTTVLETGERVPAFEIDEALIVRPRVWTSEEERINYLRLKRNVLRVLPYAIYTQNRYIQLDKDLAEAQNKREERRLVKECEREIKQKFNNEIKNLTITQGKILVKLIERQTGSTSYQLIRDMKGGITASVYQGVAKVFGHNLKAKYNAQEDYEIENIINEYVRIRPIPKSINKGGSE